jgi:hypothetical protein
MSACKAENYWIWTSLRRPLQTGRFNFCGGGAFRTLPRLVQAVREPNVQAVHALWNLSSMPKACLQKRIACLSL